MSRAKKNVTGKKKNTGMGWGGTEYVLGGLIFFSFLDILNTLLIYIYIYIKCPDKFLVGFKFWSSWGPDTKIQKHPLGWIFLKSV